MAILSAISFGLSNASTRRGVQGIPAFLGIHITVFVGIPLFVVAATTTGQLLDLVNLSTKSYILLAAAGLNQFLIGRYTLYRAIAALGSNRTSPIRSLSVPFTLIVAIFIMGEHVSTINGVGIVIVVLAPAIMFQRKGEPASFGASSLREGYFFGFVSALASGVTPILIREAIGGTGLGIAGGLVSYSSAAVPLVLGLAWPGRLDNLQSMDKTSLRWFLLTAFGLFIAHMFRFAAFDLATVTVVTPLMRAGTIFTVIFAYLINRQLEAFGAKVLAAIALSIVGSVFVVL